MQVYQVAGNGLGAGTGHVARGTVWFFRYDGTLLEVDLATGTHVVNRGSVGRVPISGCTNGRELFFSVAVNPGIPYHIFAVDLQSNPLQVRPIASLSTAPGTTVPRNGATMCMGRDGKVMLLDDVLLELDPETGVMQQIGAPYWQGTSGPPPYPWVVTNLGYNPWNHTATAVAFTPNALVHWDANLGWSLIWPSTLFRIYTTHTTSPAPFILFGKGCFNSANAEPRLGWRGLPRIGQSFDITLRNGEPNSLGLFWFGWSDRIWPGVGLLPLDAGVVGAPGCRLLVSPDATVLTPLTANGSGSLQGTLPNSAALSGYEIYAQAASLSSVNALGFVSSDAVAIRIR